MEDLHRDRRVSTEEEQDMKNIIKNRVSHIAAITVVGLSRSFGITSQEEQHGTQN